MSIWYAYLIGVISALFLVRLGFEAKLGLAFYMVIFVLTLMLHLTFRIGEGWAEKKAELDRKRDQRLP